MLYATSYYYFLCDCYIEKKGPNVVTFTAKEKLGPLFSRRFTMLITEKAVVEELVLLLVGGTFYQHTADEEEDYNFQICNVALVSVVCIQLSLIMLLVFNLCFFMSEPNPISLSLPHCRLQVF